jgi:predicted molibdopterin-dependent oxidoreductase YjgC
VVQEIFPSLTTAYAHVVLPGGSFLEKDGSFTNGERRVQRVRKILSSPGEAQADLDVFRALYRASGLPDPGDAAAVMEEIGRLWPAFSGIRQDRLDAVGLQWPVLGLDHPGTPTLHTESFPLGKAELRRIDFVPSPNIGQPLTLTTGRVLEHYNTGSMTRRTPNKQLHPIDLLEIHPQDAGAYALQDGQPLRLWNEHGEAFATAKVTTRVAPGTLFLSFHHPESGTNHLLGDVHDRVTGCPEYKLIGVQLEALPTSAASAVT